MKNRASKISVKRVGGIVLMLLSSFIFLVVHGADDLFEGWSNGLTEQELYNATNTYNGPNNILC